MRNQKNREHREALREEVQERNYQARLHRQVPQAPPQARQEPQVRQEQQDNGNPQHQEQLEGGNPPRQGRHHPRPQHNEEQCYGKVKFTMPKFSGSNDPEEYLSWALKLDKIFRLHNYVEEKKIAMASLEFQECVLI